MNECVQIKQKYFGNFISSSESTFFIRLKASYSAPPSSHTQHEEHSSIAAKESLHLFSALSLPAWWFPPPRQVLFRKPSPDSNFEKHFAYFRFLFSLWVNHRITSVSFLHFPHRETFSCNTKSKGPLKRLFLPTLLSCSAYLTEE